MEKPVNKRLVVPDNSRRETIIAIVLGILLFVGIIYGIMNMGTGVAGKTLTGKIVLKEFKPQPEEQITIGKSGVKMKSIDGEYSFEVDVEGRVYIVWVQKEIYEAKKIGEEFTFPRPAE